MSRPFSAFVTFLTVLAALAMLTGCGEKKEPVDATPEVKLQGINLLLDWNPNPNHAGIFTGIEKKRFLDRALKVKTIVPTDPAAVIQQVASGRAEVGISYQSEVLAARDKGAKVKAIASLVGTPLNSMIWLKKSGIKSVKDLDGKEIGYSGAYSQAYIKTILEHNGVDPKSVKMRDVAYDGLNNLIAGNVDAVTDVYWNVEGVTLKQKKRPATVMPLDRLGVPKYYELVIIAGESTLENRDKSDKIRRFLAGLAEGTTDAAADPKAAAQAVYAADKSQDLAAVQAGTAVTLPVLDKREPGKPFGFIDPQTWQTYADWMRDNGLLKNAPEPGAAYDSNYLPPTDGS